MPHSRPSPRWLRTAQSVEAGPSRRYGRLDKRSPEAHIHLSEVKGGGAHAGGTSRPVSAGVPVFEPDRVLRVCGVCFVGDHPPAATETSTKALRRRTA